jgi:hypothetical protein
MTKPFTMDALANKVRSMIEPMPAGSVIAGNATPPPPARPVG